MHTKQCNIEEGLGDEVSVGDGIERVLKSTSEPERSCGAIGVKRQRRAGQRPRTQWRHVHALTGGE